MIATALFSSFVAVRPILTVVGPTAKPVNEKLVAATPVVFYLNSIADGVSTLTSESLFIVILPGASPVRIVCVPPPSITVFTPPFISLCYPPLLTIKRSLFLISALCPLTLIIEP
ncbi:hypothetical protein ROK90_21900 [Cronobacter dublinensis]|uniref:hypothetical protein n=1 Tax=Cronobacter dublinensis TaxID=413497 RepID=UPI0023DCF8E9|nr:hypothetical protein [Cronobacter dublinensis]MDT3668631.1 hypothetical protein [Cronobacter dublinensis]WEP45448.1 hypothetical protein NNQ27_00330 [Cronobacter dublinensis]